MAACMLADPLDLACCNDNKLVVQLLVFSWNRLRHAMVLVQKIIDVRIGLL